MNKLFLTAIVSAVAFCCFAGPAASKGGKGMTWVKFRHDSLTGTDHVGCDNGITCNAYTGDTACKVALPVLCRKNDNSPNPGVPTDFYNGWKKGHIATTMPISGTALTSQAVADQICAATFGRGWVMADFHHPEGGWSWSSFGNARTDTRYWVRIRDQPANCWNP